MKQSIFIFCLFLILFGCKKEKANIIINTDKISYNNFDFPIELLSVKYFFNPNPMDPYCGENIPFPEDSASFYSIDVNQDSILNFLFTIEHYRMPDNSDCGGHCPYGGIYSYYIRISCLNIDDSISEDTDQNRSFLIKKYDNSESIYNNAIWINGTLDIKMSMDCFGVFYGFEETYIGIKSKNNYGWIHISPIQREGIKIHDFAINLTENKSINAGQKE